MTKKPVFDPTKPVWTSDGRKARIVCTDRNNTKPIMALIADKQGLEDCYLFRSNGEGDFFCLVNAPEKRSGWIAVYSTTGHSSVFYQTEEEARRQARKFCDGIGAVFIEYEMPDGTVK